MRVRLTPAGLPFAAAVLPAERLGQVEQGEPLMLSEMVEVYRTAGADLDAGLVERVAA